MSSLSPKDRVSLCMFTFSDGRRCRTPRIGSHPHFCYCHAQKEARARAAEKLGKDLAYFFSGDYLSACDLSTALGRLIPAVIRGEVKPRTARTVAYLAQTLMQAIHISQDEYINAFDTDGWRQSIRDSVNFNHDYLFPPAPAATDANSPAPAQPESPQPQHPASPPADTPLNCHSERSEQIGETPLNCHSEQSEESAFSVARADLTQIAPAQPQTQPQQAASQPAQTPLNCHSEQSEESAFSSSRADHSPLPQAEGPHPLPTTQSARSLPAPTAQRGNPPPTRPSAPQPAPNRDPYALHFDHHCRLRIDGKLV
jgi:hypothetical protein